MSHDLLVRRCLALALVAALTPHGIARAADVPSATPGAAPAAGAAPSPAAMPSLVPPEELTLKMGQQMEFTPTKAHEASRYYRTGASFEWPDFKGGPVPAPKKNYWIPALEVFGINMSIWGYNYVVGKDFAKISLDSISDNFHKGWIVDTDDFWANQFLHPYHGSLTYNAARSMGLNFYESWAYSFAGSLMWEQFLEVQPPSMNDQVNTPFGGALLGEVLWRMHRLVLDSGGYNPGPWRQFFATLISPMAGVNQLMFGDEYRGSLVLPQSWTGEFRAGMLISGESTDNRTGATTSQQGPWFAAGMNLVYGIPGTPDLRLRKPFDHFDFQATIATTDTPQPTATLVIQGLLHGDTIGNGGDFGGLWGLYASYDFMGEQVYRAAGFGVGPGVELMKRWDWFELHGSSLLELLPWSGAGSTVPFGARDYQYGIGAKGYVQVQMNFDDRATVRLTGREYWVSGNYTRGSTQDVSFLTAAATLRIWGPHGITGTFDWSRRNATYKDEQSIDQKGHYWTIQYALLQGW